MDYNVSFLGGNVVIVGGEVECFLDKLKEDTDRIKNEPKLLIAADKTTNFYKLGPSTYNDLLEKKHHKILQERTTRDNASNP